MCGYVAHSSQNVRVRKDTFLPGLLAQFMRAHDKHKRACVHPCAHAHAPQAVLHAHARTKLNTLYVSMSKHARTHTHSYTCAAVNAWADTHIAHTANCIPFTIYYTLHIITCCLYLRALARGKCLQARTHLGTCTLLLTHTCAHVYTHTRIHACTLAHTHTQIHAKTHNTYTHKHIHNKNSG
jgi:hypothetical protein